MCEHGFIGACAICDGCGQSPEPYENDLEEMGNREAFEDAMAEREDEWPCGDHDGDPFVGEPMEQPEF